MINHDDVANPLDYYVTVKHGEDITETFDNREAATRRQEELAEEGISSQAYEHKHKWIVTPYRWLKGKEQTEKVSAWIQRADETEKQYHDRCQHYRFMGYDPDNPDVPLD